MDTEQELNGFIEKRKKFVSLGKAMKWKEKIIDEFLPDEWQSIEYFYEKIKNSCSEDWKMIDFPCTHESKSTGKPKVSRTRTEAQHQVGNVIENLSSKSKQVLEKKDGERKRKLYRKNVNVNLRKP